MEVERALGTLDATRKVPRNPGLPREEHIQGNTVVHGDVFGGGDASAVTGNTEVRVLDHTKVHGNIYGGGNEGVVGGNTKVIVNGK